jgi:hypothetical protein
MPFGSEKYTPRHERNQPEQSPEREDIAPTGSDLIERFRAGLIPSNQTTQLGAEDLRLAVQLSRTHTLEDEVARELVGSAYELNRGAVHAGTHELEPLLAELTAAIYGAPDIGPTQLHDRWSPDSYEQPLHHAEHIFENSGMTFALRVAPGREADDIHSNPNATLRFRLGPADTWYMQIGHQDPVALVPEIPVTMGRAGHGHDSDPYTLGTNSNTSRSHLTIEAVPAVGLKVTDHSTLGTHFVTQEYPVPSEVRRRQSAAGNVDDDLRLDDARHRIESS